MDAPNMSQMEEADTTENDEFRASSLELKDQSSATAQTQILNDILPGFGPNKNGDEEEEDTDLEKPSMPPQRDVMEDEPLDEEDEDDSDAEYDDYGNRIPPTPGFWTKPKCFCVFAALLVVFFLGGTVLYYSYYLDDDEEDAADEAPPPTLAPSLQTRLR